MFSSMMKDFRKAWNRDPIVFVGQAMVTVSLSIIASLALVALGAAVIVEIHNGVSLAGAATVILSAMFVFGFVFGRTDR